MQTICEIIRVMPTLTLWRDMYKLVEMMVRENVPSWWCFQVRRGYKIVTHLPTSQKGFRREFAFVYFGGDWGCQLSNYELNFRVPKQNNEEGVAACYM